MAKTLPHPCNHPCNHQARTPPFALCIHCLKVAVRALYMIKGLLSMRSAGAGLSVLRSRPTAGDGATPPFTTVHRLSSPFHHLSPPFHHLSTALHSLSPPFTSFHRLSPWCRCRHRSGGLCTQIGRCRSGTATASSRVGETPGITFGTASPCVFTAFRSIFTDIPPPFPDLPL